MTERLRTILILAMVFAMGLQVGFNRPNAVKTELSRVASAFETGSFFDASSSSLSFRLANEQSFGFFDDISDENWKLMQERARKRVNHRYDPAHLYDNISLWYLNNFEPEFTCGQQRRLGPPGDGPKWICDPHRLVNIAKRRERENGNETGCLVYSVGCGGKWHLEEGLLDYIGNVCEIHIFDPKNFAKDNPALVQNESNKVHYHQWAFQSSYDNVSDYQPFMKTNLFKTFNETLRELGHENRPIDIFKIDCEFCEWYSFRDWFQADIRQLLVETHNLPAEPSDALDYFYGIQQHNFYLYHKEPNIHPNAKGQGIEWAYIRLHPDFANNSANNNNEATTR